MDYRHAGKAMVAKSNTIIDDARNAASNHLSALSSRRSRKALVRFRCGATIAGLFLLLCVAASACQAQSREMICSAGTGEFETEFSTGVKAHVGPARNGGLATRSCEATLNGGKGDLVIATGASQLDIDAFGVDLGVGAPVVTFQIKKTSSECCRTYQIYALEKPPRLLRVLAGADFFSAADTDLDGRLEIWTDDAASVDGIEKLPLAELDFAPPIILRFAHGKLLDVSSEFQSYFDQKIAEERSGLDAQDLRDFKSSDGRLPSDAPFSPHRLYQLRTAKMKVLEIVWSYLYSGREQEAWRALADMWPAKDVDRIHAVILNARDHGIRSQVDGASTEGPPGPKKHTRIFDLRTRWAAREGSPAASSTMERTINGTVIPPRPILMQRPPPSGVSDQGMPQLESELDLVIDSAGKVRSAKPSGNVPWVDTSLINATAKWKFIPAFSAGRPVASQIHLAVSLKR
jgi:hypothetical protein